MILNQHFPELLNIHKNVKGRCILDGVLFIMRDGRPNFADVAKRVLTSDNYKIELLAKRYPATFVAYDILYGRGKSMTDLPLLQRKQKLETLIKEENDKFTYARYVRECGVALYEGAKEKDLEGVIAKHIDSKYYFGKRTQDWLKIKNMLDDDYIICGYMLNKASIGTLVLGQYSAHMALVYKGRVTGIPKKVFDLILALPEVACPFAQHPNAAIRWVKPILVCKVKFMEYTATGGMRQPTFISLRDDKLATDCIDKKNPQGFRCP